MLCGGGVWEAEGWGRWEPLMGFWEFKALSMVGKELGSLEKAKKMILQCLMPLPCHHTQQSLLRCQGTSPV